jgi:toxin ParE1/3/4
MSRIVRTDRADEDLITIWLEEAAYNPDAANRLLDSIERRWFQLVAYPYSGVARNDIGTGIRHLTVGRYLTLYRITDDVIEILRVLHGRSDISNKSVD